MSTTLDERIEVFVQRMLPKRSRRVLGNKVIHDPILGTNIFFEHEIAMMDTPLMQRLRFIHQTGLTFYTYPGSVHSRFDHSLGITVLATKLVEKLKRKGIHIDDEPYKGNLAEIRMAALLHDCGHGIFSHLSETIYKKHSDIINIKKTREFVDCSASEILSYKIIKSNGFKDWFKKNILESYHNLGLDLNLDNIANMIIGLPSNNRPKAHFIPEIINGPIDADKLDYIQRDSYFSGISLTIDIERLLHTVSTFEFSQDNNEHLTLTSYIPLEQLLFSKMVLFSSVYHHPKVKACDSMIESIIEYITSNDISFLEQNKLKHPLDYLLLTDNDFLGSSRTMKDHFITKMLNRFKSRNLFERALAISYPTIKNHPEAMTKITSLFRDDAQVKNIRKNIYNGLPAAAKKKISLGEICISLPSLPPFAEDTGEATNIFVMVGTKEKKVPIPVYELFPVGGWLKAYADRKWRGHVFSPTEVKDEVGKSAFEVFKSEGIELNENSLLFAKLSSNK